MTQIHSINKMSYNNKITTNYIHKMGKKQHALGRSIQVKVAVYCNIKCQNRQHTYIQDTDYPAQRIYINPYMYMNMNKISKTSNK